MKSKTKILWASLGTSLLVALVAALAVSRQPIAAMTAHAMAGDRDRCLAAGMNHYISKPLQKAELLDLLQQIGANRTSPIIPDIPATPTTCS